MNQGELVKGYRGHPSPIEKYDLITAGRYPAAATTQAMAQWFDPEVPRWFGFCHGWANAAIVEKIDFQPSAEKGIFLNVGDKKGLLTAIHAEDIIDFEYCWHSPEPFHRYLLTYIGELKQAMAAELDPSDEFWSYPVYKYRMTIDDRGSYDNVTCTITHADDQHLVNGPDTEGTQAVEKTYYYRLDKDDNGDYLVAGGAWLGTSVADHPDMVWVPVGTPEHGILDYETVLAIAEGQDDDLEGGSLSPGFHQLVVFPQESDVFELVAAAGDTIRLRVALDYQSAAGNSARLLYALGADKREITLSEIYQELEFNFSEDGDSLRLSFLPGSENDRGVSVLLYLDHQSSNTSYYYPLPSTSFWLGGVSLSSGSAASDGGSSFSLQLLDETGQPAGCGYGPLWLTEGERRQYVIDLPETDNFLTGKKACGVKVSSSRPLSSLLMAGTANRLSGLNTSVYELGEFIFAEAENGFTYSRMVEWQLANHASDEMILGLSYYYSDGRLYRQTEYELDGQTAVDFSNGKYPGSANVRGWARLTVAAPGFWAGIRIREGLEVTDQLPLLQEINQGQVTHVAAGSGWVTNLTLINTGSEPNNLSLKAFLPTGQAVEALLPLAAHEKRTLGLDGSLWGLSASDMNGAWLAIEGDALWAGYWQYVYGSQAKASLPLSAEDDNDTRVLPHVAVGSGWWTGIVLINPGDGIRQPVLEGLAADGSRLESVTLNLAPQSKYTATATQVFSEMVAGQIRALRLASGAGLPAMAIYGNWSSDVSLTALNW